MDKAIELILVEAGAEPYQEEYRLAVMADTDGGIYAYTAAYAMSNDVLMKNYYFQNR